VAIPIAQGNRPELLRQTSVPASPPRLLGPDDSYTGRRRRREGDRLANISGASSILRERARPNWRANAPRSSSPRQNSHADECRAQAMELLERRRAVAGVDLHVNQHPVGQATAGSVNGPIAPVAFRLIRDNQEPATP
jgi:hypothetical protein